MTHEDKNRFDELAEKLLLHMMDKSQSQKNTQMQDPDGKTVIHIHQHFDELIVAILYLMSQQDLVDKTSPLDKVPNHDIEELIEIIDQIKATNQTFTEKAVQLLKVEEK